jgi:CcmD family protein
MTTRSVHDAPMPPGSPVRLDVTLASTPEAGTALETGAALEASAALPDTTRYDSAWASTEMPTKEPQGFEQFMVGGGKMYVVLAVVLIIWIGLLAFLFSTDRRIRSLERDAD